MELVWALLKNKIAHLTFTSGLELSDYMFYLIFFNFLD